MAARLSGAQQGFDLAPHHFEARNRHKLKVALTSPPLGIDCAPFGRNFASFTALALDGRPLANSQHLLVTLVGRAGNPDLQWNEARTSAGSPWGHGPSVAEQVPATLRIQCAPGRAVHPLAPDGSRLPALPAHYENGWLSFSTHDGAPSIHYEIVGTE